MKKTLSLLLSVIFILTIVFGVLPGPKAEAVDTGATYTTVNGTYTLTELQRPTVQSGSYVTSYGTANLIVFKQGDYFVVWADSTVTDTNENIIAAALNFDPSLTKKDKGQDAPIIGAVTKLESFNMKTILQDYNGIEISNESVNVDVSIITTTQTFSCSKSVSHIDLLQFDPPMEYGSLIVQKDVLGEIANQNEKFSITVTFNGPNLSGITYQLAGQTTNVSPDGICTLSLSDADGPVTFTDIPVGTSYTVTESLTADQIAAGWVTEDIYYNDPDTVPAIDEKDDSDSVIVKNKVYDPGLLYVKKVVSSGSEDVYFPIKVEFSHNNLAVDWSKITLPQSATGSNGTYFISLKHNEMVAFEKLPYGTTYTVTEMSLNPGWSEVSTDYSDSDQAIDSAGDDDTVTVYNEYTEPQFGELIVTKALDEDSNTSYDPDQLFTINVEFTNDNTLLSDIQYTKSDNAIIVTGSNGSYEVQLGINDTVTFTNIPYDTSYDVTEPSTPFGWSNTGISFDDQTPPVKTVDDPSDTVIVTNMYTQYYGSLDITKDVLNTLNEYPSFDIKVEFTVPAGSDPSVINYGQTSGTPDTDESLKVFFNLSLSDMDMASFTSIPVGTTYVVTEALTTDQVGAGWVNDAVNYADTSMVISDSEENDTVTVENSLRGSLIVTKQVSSDYDYGDSPTFKIVVTFSGEDLSDITYKGNAKLKKTIGKYVCSLEAGESITFSNIPEGVTYTVKETLNEALKEAGWSKAGITYGNTNHRITAGNTDTVTVYNTYVEPEEPILGTLSVFKTVNTGASTSEKFEILVTFTGDGIDSIKSDDEELQPSSSDENSVTYTLYLSEDDGEFVFFNILEGIEYEVTEVLTQAQQNNNWSRANADVTGTITYNEETQLYLNASAEVINSHNPPPPPPPPPGPEFGSLLVDKVVSGENPLVADPNAESFAFTVTFRANPQNVSDIVNSAGLTPTINGANSTYTFSLSADGTPVSFSNIPVGTTYTVSEAITTDQSNLGWSMDTESNTSGNIVVGAITATITNTISSGVAGASDIPESPDTGVMGDSDILPQTGGISPATLIGIFGLALIAIGGTALAILKRKNTDETKEK